MYGRNRGLGDGCRVLIGGKGIGRLGVRRWIVEACRVYVHGMQGLYMDRKLGI